MPVPSPQQIQYLGSLESQELTIQKQANLGVTEGQPLSAQGPLNHMGPSPAATQHMAQQQGMLQGLGHPSDIPPLDMGASLASENSQGSYHSSCSSGMEGPRMGPAMQDGPRFPTSPPYDRFPGHEAPSFGYMDPRCRTMGPDSDPSDPSQQQGRFPGPHHPGFPAGTMPPHQGAAFPGAASQGGPAAGARDFSEPMMGAGGFPRPGSYAGDVPHSPHIQSLQKMTPPFDGGPKGEVVAADPLNGPHHRGSPGCMVPMEPASAAQFMAGGGPMVPHGRGAATPYATGMAPARNSPGPRSRGRGAAASAAAANTAAAFGGGANVQVKLGAPNTIQYLPARPQNPVVAPPHRAPSLDFLQRFATPLTNLDAKVPTQNLQYFPPSGPPQRAGPVMMMRGGPAGAGVYAGARGLPPMDAYAGGPNGPQHGMPVGAMFQGGKGMRPASPGGGPGGEVVSQPLPPTVGQSFSYKQSPFYGPTTADPNYAVQFHNFQQQLYATNTRSQGGAASGPSNATAAAAAGFFGPK